MELRPSVLITGASSGIGEYLAYEFSRKGYRVSLCARRIDRLRKIADRCLAISPTSLPLIFETDVTDRNAVDQAVASTLKTFGRLDIVIANAGFGVGGSFDKLSLEDFHRQFRTNIDGVLNSAWASLEALKTSKGALFFIGSINSYVSQPRKAPYCMSKFAVRALAESLYVELKPHGVHIGLICPGMVESEIRQVDNLGHFHSEGVAKPPSWITMPTDQAARQMVSGILKRKREILITHHGKWGVFLARFAPGFLLWILGRFNPQGYESSLRPR